MQKFFIILIASDQSFTSCPIQGPATLQLPVLSHTAFSLMTSEHSLSCDKKMAAEEVNWLPSNVRLGECREKVEQIRVLNQLMWLHSSEPTTEATVNRCVTVYHYL